MGTTIITMRPATAFLLLGFVSCAYAGRIFILDDGEDDGVAHRVRRDAPPYGPPAPAHTTQHLIMDQRAGLDPSTLSSRLTHRPTSSGVSGTGLVPNTEDEHFSELKKTSQPEAKKDLHQRQRT